jgi:hypothetical protein
MLISFVDFELAFHRSQDHMSLVTDFKYFYAVFCFYLNFQ